MAYYIKDMDLEELMSNLESNIDCLDENELHGEIHCAAHELVNRVRAAITALAA